MIAAIDPTSTLFWDERGHATLLPTPAGMLTDPRFLLEALRFRCGISGEATVVVEHPIDWTTDLNGWTPIGKHQPGQHWRAFGKDGARVNVLTMDDRDPDANDPLTDPENRALGTVADRLSAWLRATGTHYYATPGVAAVINLRASWGDGPQPQWRLISPASAMAWKPPASIEAIDWAPRRPRTQLWRWDMRMAFLAAMAAVQLPFRQLVPTGVEPSTLDCGYYRIRPHQLVPSWADIKPDRSGTAWVCQGMLEWHTKEYGQPEIIDSWTPRQTHPRAGDAIVAAVGGRSGHRRLLRHWAEEWGHIHQPALNPTLKAAYAQLVGLMNVSSGQIYRPDWRHMIIDQQRASMVRRIHNVFISTGIEPVAIATDSVYYRATHQAKLIEAQLGIGGAVGNMRFEGITKL